VQYDPEALRLFYDQYARHEWTRVEGDVFGRLVSERHDDLLRRFIGAGMRVVDVGCGPGRFARTVARLGARVTLVDLSAVQLALAAETLAATGENGAVDGALQADVVELSGVPTGAFDAALCFGAPLSYCGSARTAAAASLRRVVKPGGLILASVPSRYGTVANLVRRATMSVLQRPDEWHVDSVLTTGDLPGFASPIDRPHPPMHLFTGDELAALFAGCELLELAGIGVAAFPQASSFDRVAADASAWQTALAIERRLGAEPSVRDGGTHLMVAVRVPPGEQP
jgi:SAM-dependent methyltransferase